VRRGVLRDGFRDDGAPVGPTVAGELNPVQGNRAVSSPKVFGTILLERARNMQKDL
jgi:hypothetical protein